MPLISIEGTDGAGKTTQIQILAEELERRGITYRVLREPGGTELGEEVRAILKGASYEIAPMAELLLFNAARAQLIHGVVGPALAAGELVILDRFTDSSLAYQGVARGLGEAPVRAACDLATGGLRPDLTILLEITMDVRNERIGSPGRDRIESAGDAFFAAVIAAYSDLARREPSRIVALDASRAPQAVAADVMAALHRAGLLSDAAE